MPPTALRECQWTGFETAASTPGETTPWPAPGAADAGPPPARTRPPAPAGPTRSPARPARGSAAGSSPSAARPTYRIGRNSSLPGSPSIEPSASIWHPPPEDGPSPKVDRLSLVMRCVPSIVETGASALDGGGETRPNPWGPAPGHSELLGVWRYRPERRSLGEEPRRGWRLGEDPLRIAAMTARRMWICFAGGLECDSVSWSTPRVPDGSRPGICTWRSRERPGDGPCSVPIAYRCSPTYEIYFVKAVGGATYGRPPSAD